MIKSRLLTTLSLAALASAPLPAWSRASDLPDRMELGRDGKGDPCAANRYWEDPLVQDPFAVSFSFTCRGATANRLLGVARQMTVAEAVVIEQQFSCGEAKDFVVEGLGSVRARRCLDKQLGLETVETRVVREGRTLSVSSVPIAQGAAEEALRLLAGTARPNPDRGRENKPGVDVSTLVAPASVASASAAIEDAQGALQLGLRFVRQGLQVEAARVLNDALARLPADAPVSTRIELLLVAGLADSNLRFFSSTEQYFNRVDQLLAANPGLPDAAVLARKRRTYSALDLLNRRDFQTAAGALDTLASAQSDPAQPLLNAADLRALNQPTRSGSADTGVVATADSGALSQLVIDAQANWARSVALLAQNRPADAGVALANADRVFAVLRNDKIDQQQVRWLDARIERQRARLLLRSGNRQGAVAALDKAIASLKRAEADGATGPSLAETQLERAGVLARGGGSRDALIAQFDEAIESLVSADTAGSVMPPAVEQYLDLLATDAAERPGGTSPEKFFRALQAVSNPAIARQFVQLQSVVTSNSRLASKVQDAADIEQELTRLRYEIADPQTDPKAVPDLEQRRAKLEGQLIALNAELDADKAYGAVNDKPATVAEVQATLRPGEAYFRLTKVRNYAFGILIDAQGAQIYRVKNPMVEVEPLAQRVRRSIDGGQQGNGKLPLFEVGAASALFKLLAGPVAERLLAANALVVDPSGPLEALPIGVLVTDDESVRAYVRNRASSPYDFSGVNFLARRMSISTALSPRSLIVSRNLAPSAAPLPFIGFAQHMPTPVSATLGGSMISVGNGCEAETSEIARLTRELSPITAQEVAQAGAALGLTQVPEMTGGAFTDTAVKARTDLDQFQVLHFATHGLTEGVWGCSKSPPALVTSLGERPSDAILSFDEIARLRLDANLVVLSACDTAAGISAEAARAAGREEAGATLEGLVRAFLAANARAVLATYWPISDAGESQALIQDFYRVARNGTIGEALRQAQLSLIDAPKSSHPLYWAPFFVVGDAQKPLLTASAAAAVQGAAAGALR